jgi:hypothetical protein
MSARSDLTFLTFDTWKISPQLSVTIDKWQFIKLGRTLSEILFSNFNSHYLWTNAQFGAYLSSKSWLNRPQSWFVNYSIRSVIKRFHHFAQKWSTLSACHVCHRICLLIIQLYTQSSIIFDRLRLLNKAKFRCLFLVLKKKQNSDSNTLRSAK